jgi:hypothetical protein
VPEQSVSVLDGSTFVVSDRSGDMVPGSRVRPHGFFSEDTRFVSRWRLSVQGQPTDVLSCAQSDYYLAYFFLVVPAPEFHAAPPLGSCAGGSSVTSGRKTSFWSTIGMSTCQCA